METVAKIRQPLKHSKEPNSKFTLRRQEFKKAEDVKLITHFAQWLSDLTDMNIQPDSFPEDLQNGIALCKVMMRIDGSGVTRYHHVKDPSQSKMDAFKARENVGAFQSACKRLDLPTSFGMDDLEAGDLGTIASTLVYVAHAAAMRNVGVKELDETLRQRLGVVVKEKQEEQQEAEAAAATSTEVSTATDVVPGLENTTAPAVATEPSQEQPAPVTSSTETKPSPATGASAVDVKQEVDYSCVGFPLAYLKSLFPEDKVSDLTIAKVASELLAPMVAEKSALGSTWSEIVYKENQQAAGESQTVSLKADIVVCCDPELRWKDMLSALDSSNASSSLLFGTTTLWIEPLCISNRITTTVDYEDKMKRVIERVGRLQLILHPWDKPSIASKSHCVWQVCCAVKAKAPIFASFLTKDAESFLELVFQGTVGSRTFQKVFYDINVERAVSADQQQTLRVTRVLKNEVGATRVNDAFVVPIKNWLTETLKQGCDRVDIISAKKSNAFMTRGAFYQCLGQPDEAKKYFEKVLQVQQENSPNKESPAIATALSNMASTLRELGEFKEAEEVCEKALKIRLACFGENHPAVTVSRAWLGDILLASGEFKRALPILEKVLEDQQKNEKAGDMEISSAMNNLASALRETGRMEEARKYFEEVLVRVERASGVDHPLYGAALNNCALTLEAQKDYQGALKMHEKSLALRTRALGLDHPDVALSIHNLGVCLLREDKVKNLDKAKELGKKALGIWEKTLGPKHPTVVEARKDWGDLVN